MANNDSMAVDPNAQYAISGAALLTVVDLLQNQIPCRYISTVDRVSTILSTVKTIQPQVVPG